MKIIAAILMCGVLAGWAGAQEIDVDTQYFHPAASCYIQGDTLGASNLVARGLANYPRNAKLKRLKELLEQQDQQQQNQDQNQEQEQEQNENEEQEQSPEQEQDENQEQEQSSEQEQEQSEDDRQQENPQQSEPEPAEQMTEDEAKQLLDAMRQEEKNKRLHLHPVMGAPVKVEKDW